MLSYSLGFVNIVTSIICIHQYLFVYIDYLEHGAIRTAQKFSKPSQKHIENKLQFDEAKLDKLWRNTTNAVTKLHETPDSLHQIKSHTSEVRSLFRQYRTISLSLLEFLGGLSDPHYKQEYETLQKLINDRSQYIQTSINEANERKKELMLEISSSHWSHSSRSSATSFTAVRALAIAEATAALK